MTQALELDLGREMERRLEAQAGALQGLLGLAQQMLELAATPQLEAARLSELVREDEKFFGRLKQLEEGLAPLRKRWVAENVDDERRRQVEQATRKVKKLIGQLAGVHEELQARLEAAQESVAAELKRLPARGRRAKTKGRTGRLVDFSS